MKDMIHYKGYYGSVHYSDDDQISSPFTHKIF